MQNSTKIMKVDPDTILISAKELNRTRKQYVDKFTPVVPPNQRSLSQKIHQQQRNTSFIKSQSTTRKQGQFKQLLQPDHVLYKGTTKYYSEFLRQDNIYDQQKVREFGTEGLLEMNSDISRQNIQNQQQNQLQQITSIKNFRRYKTTHCNYIRDEALEMESDNGHQITPNVVSNSQCTGLGIAPTVFNPNEFRNQFANIRNNDALQSEMFQKKNLVNNFIFLQQVIELYKYSNKQYPDLKQRNVIRESILSDNQLRSLIISLIQLVTDQCFSLTAVSILLQFCECDLRVSQIQAFKPLFSCLSNEILLQLLPNHQLYCRLYALFASFDVCCIDKIAPHYKLFCQEIDVEKTTKMRADLQLDICDKISYAGSSGLIASFMIQSHSDNLERLTFEIATNNNIVNSGMYVVAFRVEDQQQNRDLKLYSYKIMDEIGIQPPPIKNQSVDLKQFQKQLQKQLDNYEFEEFLKRHTFTDEQDNFANPFMADLGAKKYLFVRSIDADVVRVSFDLYSNNNKICVLLLAQNMKQDVQMNYIKIVKFNPEYELPPKQFLGPAALYRATARDRNYYRKYNQAELITEITFDLLNSEFNNLSDLVAVLQQNQQNTVKEFENKLIREGYDDKKIAKIVQSREDERNRQVPSFFELIGDQDLFFESYKDTSKMINILKDNGLEVKKLRFPTLRETGDQILQSVINEALMKPDTSMGTLGFLADLIFNQCFENVIDQKDKQQDNQYLSDSADL